MKTEDIRYYIDYQYLPKNRSRPIDDGAIVDIRATDKSGFAIIPNVGDYVYIDCSMTKEGNEFIASILWEAITKRNGMPNKAMYPTIRGENDDYR